MQAFIAMAILETLHHLLQSHVDNRRGSEAMQTLAELLDRAMQGQKTLHFSFRRSEILCQGSPLPESSVSQELCRIFLREGFVDLVFLPRPGALELALWVDILRAHYRRRVACDAEQSLQPCLLSAEFHHLKFGFSLTRKLQNQEGEFGPRWEPGSGRGVMTWEEEALMESCRQLELDFGMTLLEDLEKRPESLDWPEEAIRILGELLEHLVAKGRYRACLPILDQALACPLPAFREGLETYLAAFRSTERLEGFLPALCTGFDPALSDFLKRLGPGIAPFLLAREDQYPTAALHALLEHFLEMDIQPFMDLLDCGNSKIKHRAISYLLDSGQTLPQHFLEELAQSRTDWIQKRAMQLLVAQDSA